MHVLRFLERVSGRLQADVYRQSYFTDFRKPETAKLINVDKNKIYREPTFSGLLLTVTLRSCCEICVKSHGGSPRCVVLKNVLEMDPRVSTVWFAHVTPCRRIPFANKSQLDFEHSTISRNVNNWRLNAKKKMYYM